LIMLQIAGKVVTGLDLQLGAAASAVRDIDSSKLDKLLGEVRECLAESGDHRLLDRFKSGLLTSSDVQKLNEEAFELLVEKANEQRGWRANMTQVRVKGETKTVWVAREHADDPLYERIRFDG